MPLSNDARKIEDLNIKKADLEKKIATLKKSGNESQATRLKQQLIQIDKQQNLLKKNIANKNPNELKVQMTDAIEYLDGILEGSEEIAGMSLGTQLPGIGGSAFNTNSAAAWYFGYDDMPKKRKISKKKIKNEESSAAIVSGPVSAGGVGGIHKRKIGEGPSKPGKYKAKSSNIFKRNIPVGKKKKKTESVDVNHFVDNLLD